MSYCSLAWQHSSKQNISKLELLQRKCIRLMSFAKYHDHSEPLFKKLNILKVKDDLRLKIMKFIFLWLDKETPSSLDGMFKKSNLHYSDKNHIKFLQPRIFTDTYGRNSLKSHGPLLWNSLNNLIVDNVSLSSFVKTLKTHFLSQYCN